MAKKKLLPKFWQNLGVILVLSNLTLGSSFAEVIKLAENIKFNNTGYGYLDFGLKSEGSNENRACRTFNADASWGDLVNSHYDVCMDINDDSLDVQLGVLKSEESDKKLTKVSIHLPEIISVQLMRGNAHSGELYEVKFDKAIMEDVLGYKDQGSALRKAIKDIIPEGLTDRIQTQIQDRFVTAIRVIVRDHGITVERDHGITVEATIHELFLNGGVKKGFLKKMVSGRETASSYPSLESTWSLEVEKDENVERK